MQYVITVMKYKYFPQSVAFQMWSGSQMQHPGTHNTWQCSRTGQSNACLVLHAYLWNRLQKKHNAYNFTMKYEITWTCEETNWWAFSRQHSGKEW